MRNSICGIVVVLGAILFLPSLSMAGAGKSGHKHGGDVGEHIGAGHIHDRWVMPPPQYVNMKGNRWNLPQAITNGERLFRKNCVVCHGEKGMGESAMAKSLDHPPANLSRHFHPNKKHNDGYLFWRLTKGGTVEPFKSQSSLMPSFEGSLNTTERWDVLAFVYNRITADGGTHTHPWDKPRLTAKSHNTKDSDHSGHSSKPNSEVHSGHDISATGVLNAVDAKKRKMNINHGAIPALGWPPMRMDFSIAPGVPLHQFKSGQRVKFYLRKSGKYEYIITNISAH